MSQSEREALYDLVLLASLLPFLVASLRTLGIRSDPVRRRAMTPAARWTTRLRFGVLAVAFGVGVWVRGGDQAPATGPWYVVVLEAAALGVIGGACLLFATKKWGARYLAWYRTQRGSKSA